MCGAARITAAAPGVGLTLTGAYRATAWCALIVYKMVTLIAAPASGDSVDDARVSA